MNISVNDYRMMCAQRETGRQSRIRALNLPTYTLDEEILNSATHALGAFLALIGWVMCMKLLVPAGCVAAGVSMSVFCLSMVLLYTNSALYHGWELTKVKKTFQIMDHCTIFLLITGTYAPYTLMVMNNTAGRIIFGVVAAASVVGIALNMIDMKRFAKISMACYLITGWCIIFAFRDISAALTQSELLMLVGGGIAYTVGAILYGLGVKIRYMHTIWHLFVLLGSVLQFAGLYEFICRKF